MRPAEHYKAAESLLDVSVAMLTQAEWEPDQRHFLRWKAELAAQRAAVHARLAATGAAVEAAELDIRMPSWTEAFKHHPAND